MKKINAAVKQAKEFVGNVVDAVAMLLTKRPAMAYAEVQRPNRVTRRR